MKLRDLSYLLALAKTEHFGKAAELAHVSQPTLSVQIKKLEERLGVILVERNNKNVRLTPEGLIIAEKAKRVFLEIEGIKTYAATLQDPRAGDLYFGIIPTLGPYLLPKIIPALHEKLPKLSMWLQEEQTEILLKKIHQGEIDLAILSLPIHDDSLTTIPLFEEPFIFAVNVENPLAKKKSISSQDIEHEKILLLSEGHCFRDQALSVCNRMHGEPLSFQATSLETLRYMVAENLGSTLIPALAAKTPGALIVYIPFKKPIPSRALALVFRKTHVRAELFAEMANIIKSSSDSLAIDRTEIVVKLSEFGGDAYISRSQAKSIFKNLDEFNVITLDFKGVRIVGQGFTDEIFRVYQNQYPDKQIKYIHANDDIEFMIKRAVATATQFHSPDS